VIQRACLYTCFIHNYPYLYKIGNKRPRKVYADKKTSHEVSSKETEEKDEEL